MYEALQRRLADPDELDRLRQQWRQTRRLRVVDALRPEVAHALVEGAAAHGFDFFEKHVSDVRCVFWRQTHRFGDPRFGPMALASRLIVDEIPRLVSAITGQALHASGAGFSIDYYTRGSYLDVHTDQGADRLVAYVIGLTAASWPAEDGGHLEFLEADFETVADRVAPGFGTLDLFTVYPLLRPHRVPLLKRPVTRLSINGWLSGGLEVDHA
jgi:hypothetical protein